MGETVTGVLSVENKKTFIKGPSGQNYLKNEHIWDGYVAHWEDQTVHARRLLQKDYDTGKHIYLLWPKKEQKSVPFFELYYNERLVKYTASSLGHNAINIGGDIFIPIFDCKKDMIIDENTIIVNNVRFILIYVCVDYLSLVLIILIVPAYYSPLFYLMCTFSY